VPDEIATLKKLDTLSLSGNPLAPEELDRIKKLLPGVTVWPMY